MNQTELASRISNHPFCKGLQDSLIHYLADCAEEKHFSRDAYLLRFQQPAEEFHLLLEGKVVLLNQLPGRKVTPFETVSAPNIIGWSWLVAPYRWHFDVKASTEVRSICVHTQCVLGKIATDSSFGSEIYRRFIEVVVDRLQAARLQAMDIYQKPEEAGL